MTETPHAAHGHAAHDDHGHGHGHGSRFIQHHYDDAQHQFDSGKLGIWLFLAQEVLFFSALFVAYVLYRHHHPEVYSYAHKYLDVKYGAINTAVLIFSSLTAAWAVRAAQLGQRKLLIGCIVVTLLCALTFLGIKYIEYSHKIHEHILFGRYFDPCVSSGGVPLLTKHNECPGSKSSVVWDYAKNDGKVGVLVEGVSIGAPTAGCYSSLELDRDPAEPGLQYECTVREVKALQAIDKDGKLVQKDGKPAPEQELASKPITQMCPDPIEAAVHKAHGGEAAPMTSESKDHADHGAGKPCWRVASQPAVCRPNFYYNAWCSGNGCPAFETVGPFFTKGACIDAKTTKTLALDKLKGADATLTYRLGDCLQTPTYGFLVEYGDHTERGEERTSGGLENIRIKAECKAPPRPVDPTELFPDKPQTLEVGKKAEPYQRATTHEEHEREAAGAPPPNTGMFFTIYFAMTGLHGIHVLAGVVVFLWLLIRAMKGHFTPDYFGPVDFAALYWHIVDLIWIFLFPLLYLIH